MTKQIRLKDGKVLKVESCLKCPLFDADGEGFMGCYTCKGNMNIDVEHPSQNNHIHNECPLEDYQEPAAPTEQGTKCGYLDCHALLTALNEEDSTGALIFRINRGEFDVRISGEALAEKDAEIARLNEVIRTTAHCHGELQREMFKQRDRIQQQDQELKDLGKALQDAREYDPFVCPRRQNACIGCPHTACPQRTKKEPPNDEPELWICPNAKQCKVEVCGAKNPHKKTELCDDLSCPVNGERSGPCIPVKKEKTVPEKDVKEGIPEIPDRPFYREHCSCKLCPTGGWAKVIDTIKSQAHTAQIKACHDRLDALEKEIAAIREKVSNS